MHHFMGSTYSITLSVWVLKYPTLYHVAINIHRGLNLDNPFDTCVKLCIISFALCNKEEFVVSLKYTSPMPLMSTSAQNGEIKNLSFIGNGSGVKVATGAVNEITPLVLICNNWRHLMVIVHF